MKKAFCFSAILVLSLLLASYNGPGSATDKIKGNPGNELNEKTIRTILHDEITRNFLERIDAINLFVANRIREKGLHAEELNKMAAAQAYAELDNFLALKNDNTFKMLISLKNTAADQLLKKYPVLAGSACDGSFQPGIAYGIFNYFLSVGSSQVIADKLLNGQTGLTGTCNTLQEFIDFIKCYLSERCYTKKGSEYLLCINSCKLKSCN